MTEVDINDAFTAMLFTEEHLIEDAHKKGFKLGSQQGNIEGYHLGYHRGAEIGAEIGYYLGFIELVNTGSQPEKVMCLLSALKQQISSFPEENTEEDILKQLDDIRTSFKKVCAILKLDSSYPETDKLSF